MIRSILIAVVASCSFTATACETLDAVFENEKASSILSVLATESGLTLMNPELATSRINATFEQDNPAKLLPVMAWDLGFELRIQGNKAWLHPASATAKAE